MMVDRYIPTRKLGRGELWFGVAKQEFIMSKNYGDEGANHNDVQGRL
jgi:hypothetical protein